MHPFPRFTPVALSVALCALLGLAMPALAQSSDDPSEPAGATVPQDRLAARYSGLVGDEAAAGELVGQLRAGGDFSVTREITTTTTNADGTTTTTTAPVTTTIANPSGPMGFGEVNITLAMAQALVDSGAAADLQSALTGTTSTVTNPDGTTTTTTTGGVLAMRADGMGWGQIAQELGFNLGNLMSAGNRNARATEAQAAGAGNAAAGASASAGAAARGSAGAQAGASARGGAGAQAGASARGGAGAQAGVSGRAGAGVPTAGGQAGRPERPAGRPEQAGGARPSRPDIGSLRPAVLERPTRPERPERPERPQRGGR